MAMFDLFRDGLFSPDHFGRLCLGLDFHFSILFQLRRLVFRVHSRFLYWVSDVDMNHGIQVNHNQLNLCALVLRVEQQALSLASTISS